MQLFISHSMIIYNSDKSEFISDVTNGIIEDKILEELRNKMHCSVSHNEIRSWTNSLEFMSLNLMDDEIPNDSRVALEYNIPHTSKRVDMIISGFDKSDKGVAVVIELKQWESAQPVLNKDGIVRTFVNGKDRETTHPSYQAFSYAEMIRDFNRDVQDNQVSLYPCAYLHNYKQTPNDPLLESIYSEYYVKAPLFFRQDASKLREFIKRFVKQGDRFSETMLSIDSGRLRPSKSLQDCLASMLKGNEEFHMIDTQKIIYEHILDSVKNPGNKKKVIIVKGGPGTGKSVLAVNLMAKFTSMDLAASYVTKNAAPRNVYNQKLKGTFKKSRVDFMFKGSGSFTTAPENAFDVLLADEAHRLNEKSGMFQNLGENQIKEIIHSSRHPVFFIDEDQRVTLNDIGTVERITEFASLAGADVDILELDSQFRCDGSDGYMAWLDNVLGIRETANIDIYDDDLNYDFRVFDDPNEMRAAIEEKNDVNNKSRIVAGYCWNWISEGKNDSSVHDIVIPEFDFQMSWNLGSSQTWAIDPESIKEAGCIHTCQGLEFDYVGVIIGDDLRYDNGVVTDYTKRAKTDQSLRGLKSKYRGEERQKVADSIIKNTYRVLMSRGMKGCYVYCVDDSLKNHFLSRI